MRHAVHPRKMTCHRTLALHTSTLRGSAHVLLNKLLTARHCNLLECGPEAHCCDSI